MRLVVHPRFAIHQWWRHYIFRHSRTVAHWHGPLTVRPSQLVYSTVCSLNHAGEKVVDSAVSAVDPTDDKFLAEDHGRQRPRAACVRSNIYRLLQ